MAKKRSTSVRRKVNLIEPPGPAVEPELVEEAGGEIRKTRLSDRLMRRIRASRGRIEKRVEARAAKLGLDPKPLIKGIWEIILLLPRLIKLVFKLTLDRRVPLRMRVLCALGLTYVLSPIDIVPEAMLGPVALLDDVALLIIILNTLLNQVDPEVVKDHWKGDEDVLRIIKESLAMVQWFMPSSVDAVMKRFFSKK